MKPLVDQTDPMRPNRPTPHTLAELAGVAGATVEWSEALVGASGAGAGAGTITGVTLDSRRVQHGDLYAALPGAHTHGARFAGPAAERGATALLTDAAGLELARAAAVSLPVLVCPDPRAALGAVSAAAYDDPSADIAVVGITGTNGKTTTAYLIEAGLSGAGLLTGLIGTIEMRVAGQAVPSARTTPEAPDLQAVLALMRERGVAGAVMEVSSHSLVLGRTDGVRFAVGAFLNLSQDHLDFHADMEDYFQSKALLFDGRCRSEVTNVADAYGRRLVRPGTVTIDPSGTVPASWRASEIAADRFGISFTVRGPDFGPHRIGVRLPGTFNVANALTAIACLHALRRDRLPDLNLTAALAGIEALPGVPGRMERVEMGQPFLALVDYAHTPDAVETLLAAVRPATSGRVIIVLGCGGDRDQAKRPLMGAAAARLADVVVVTDDNPRSEEPAAIRTAVLSGARAEPGGSAEVREVADRGEAIDLATHLASAGDVLVLAGKGHEQGQDFGGVLEPFDDRQVLREALLRRYGPGSR